MDLLFSKYADPFSLLDELIPNGDFFDWTIEFVNSENDRQIWEMWLHKIIDKSYEEFRNSVIKTNITVNESDLETTVMDSKSILNGFIPKGVK